MKELFDDEMNGAIFNDEHKYRFVLWRIWAKGCSNIMFIGLNPSIADGNVNDPTIRRLVSFAKKWGFGGMYMLNLFTYISTDPKKLQSIKEPDYLSDDYLLDYRQKVNKIVFAWGSNKFAQERAKRVIDLFPWSYCFGTNEDGSPKHPLYLPKTTELIPFKQQ